MTDWTLSHRLLLSIFISFLFPTTTAYAGAWTLVGGDSDFILTTTYYETDDYFDMGDNRQSQPTYRKATLNPYYEYGYRDGLTLGMSTEMGYTDQERLLPTGSYLDGNYGIGDVELFARYRLWQNDSSVISIQPLVKTPRLHQEDEFPAIGTDQWDMELMLLGGHGFNWLGRHHYIEGGAGYRWRLDEPSDQIRAYGRLGLTLADSWQTMITLSHTESLNSGANPFNQISPEADYDLTKAEASVIYALSETQSIQLGGFAHLEPENTGGGGGALLAWWYQW